MRRALCALVGALLITAGCAAKTNDGLTTNASTWLTAEIAAARAAATQGNYREATNALAAIEASVRTFRSQHAISEDRAARVLSAVQHVRAALSRYTTPTTMSTTPPATVVPKPGPGNGKHGHNRKGDGDNGD